MEDCGASNAEYLVHLVYMNRGYMHVASFVVCIVGNLNGKRCRDGVKVLWCHSNLISCGLLLGSPKNSP